MKFIHIADLHIGQIIYQNYDRVDEHTHFFKQLEKWCREEQPDALLVCGDVFDAQQPSATVKEMFNTFFAKLKHDNPNMSLIITAGNHDSASRLQADAPLWNGMEATMIGVAPSPNIDSLRQDWQKDYIVKLDSGYVIAMPYSNGNRKEILQQLLDNIANENSNQLPVVMMAHQTISSANTEGHNIEIGRVASQEVSEFGTGFDYLALGHIHRPQTIGAPLDDENDAESTYPAGIARYCGSALHVSCDEKYPHTVSVVEIAEHGGDVHLKRLRIDELLHFYELPNGKAAQNEEEALNSVRDFVAHNDKGYIRLHIAHNVNTSSDFDQKVYGIIAEKPNIRYNPRIVWEGVANNTSNETATAQISITEIQEINDPMVFLTEMIKKDYGFTTDELKSAFDEVMAEVEKMQDEESAKKSSKKKAEKQ